MPLSARARWALAACLMAPFAYTTAEPSCRTLEYAEIKDMLLPDLTRTFCQYLKFGQMDMDTASQLNAAYIDAIRRTPGLARSINTSKVDEYHASAAICLQQAQKIGAAMVSRGETRNPPCTPEAR